MSIFSKTVESQKDREQIGFYDPGVGTFGLFGRFLGKKIGIFMGEAFGWGLQKNIEDAYEYLMSFYEEGDHLYLFGFSRGAFTVRSLAGMLHKCGLLHRGSKNLIPYASAMYNQPDNNAITEGFKATYCQPCKPYFIGVWDTVESLGYFYGKRFFDATLHHDTPYGYHAIAIDEKREKFLPSIWDEANKAPHQTIEQVWFPGVHADVGGSYTERGLSDGAFEWMMWRSYRAGLRLKSNWRDGLETDPTDSKSLHESRTGLWKLWPAVHRDIPEGALVHQSVVDRINAGLGYNPLNLPRKYTVIASDPDNPLPDNPLPDNPLKEVRQERVT